jgi:hypothetical protein
MAKQLVIVLCEGPHDVAFLVRILKCEGFESNEKTKIGDFPPPLNDLLKQEAQKADVERLNLQEISKVLLPFKTLKRDENYLFFYSLGGDGKKAERQKMLETLLSYIPVDAGEISVLPTDTKLALLYFFDADEGGVKARIRAVNEEINGILLLETDVFANHAETKTVHQILLGNYIFSDPRTGKGRLEDILLPLMSKNNDGIFNGAKKFLQEQFDQQRLFKLKLKRENNIVHEYRSQKKDDKFKFDPSKSQIGVAGQLQESGFSNVVAISNSDYLTFDKIKNDAVCQEIARFFNDFCGQIEAFALPPNAETKTAD